MAKIYGQLEKAQFEIWSSPPTGVEGQVGYNSTSKKGQFHNGTGFVSFGADVTLAAVGAVPNANGATLADQVLNLQPASATFPGIVTAGAQTLGGDKTFQDNLILQKLFSLSQVADGTTTGTAAALALPTKSHIIFTNGSLVSLETIVAPTTSTLLLLTNKTGNSISVLDESGATAANRIRTGTGAQIGVANNASLLLIYDLVNSRWSVIGGTGGGTVLVGSSLALTGGGTVTVTQTDSVQSYRVQGASAAVALSSTPFGSTAPANGTYVELVGNDDTNTVDITNNDAAKGCVGNFSTITLAKYQVVGFRYNSTLDRWVLCSKS